MIFNYPDKFTVKIRYSESIFSREKEDKDIFKKVDDEYILSEELECNYEI